MPFKAQSYLASLDKNRLAQLIATTSQVGTHPETQDGFLIPTIDRYSGTYILGVQGVGKSGLLENLILQDIMNSQAVIVVDPHGDLIQKLIARIPDQFLPKTYLLDMQDEKHPFGINVFTTNDLNSAEARTQAVDRVMHCFEVLWADVLDQIYLPRYLRAATIALFANKGSSLVDMNRFLTDGSYRSLMLDNVEDQSVKQFWRAYDELSSPERRQQIAPLVTRLESLFMGRSIVRDIVGQRETSINFRRAIENKEIIFVKLPFKTLPQDSKLIGTLVLAQIHAAIFSFANLPERDRPGFSLYVDEFQHFATSDFSVMFTEGRKFGVRVTVAHQYRGQLPTFLRESTLTARSKVCFQCTPDDAREMAYFYLSGEASVQPEDIEPRPVEWLLRYGSDNPDVQTFIDWYLLPLQSQKRSGQVEITHPGFRSEHIGFWLTNTEPPKEKPKEPDPTLYLNNLLYQVMKTGNASLQIPSEIVYGFANCGRGFYSTWRRALKGKYLSSRLRYPRALVVRTANGLEWTRPPEDSNEQLYHFLFHLRSTMAFLSQNPLGKKTSASTTEISRMLMQLPRRAAFVRSGDDVGVVYTDDSLESVGEYEFYGRIGIIKAQTVEKYCRMIDDQPSLDVSVAKSQFRRWQEVK